MKKYLLLLFIALTFFGCEKLFIENKFIIEGTVFDEITNEPIKDVNFELQSVTTSFMGGSRKSIASLVTDSDGKYKIVFKPKKDVSRYHVYAINDNYFDISMGFGIQPENLTKGNPTLLNLKFTPKSTLRINFRNLNPVNETDKLEYHVSSEKARNLIFSSNYGHSEFDFIAYGNAYIGAGANGTDEFSVAGDKYAKISIVITKDKIVKKLTDSIYCKRNQTQTYTVNY